MSIKHYLIGALVLVAFLGFIACEQKPPGPEELMKKAQEIAQIEMARFEEKEATYKEQTRLFEIPANPGGITGSHYCKVYRAFLEYNVLDVRKTDSILHPILADIKYIYNVYNTYPRSTGLMGEPEKAEDDTEFTLNRKGEFIYTYRLNEFGERVDDEPGLPPAPEYWKPHDYGPTGAKNWPPDRPT